MAPVAAAGCVAGSWPVPTAVDLNFGFPKPLSWLMGKWYIEVISPTLDRAKADGWVYRKEEYGANSGFVRINPDHTFVWQIFPQDPVSKQIKGTWRLATDAEMGLQGGAGIVLIRGESATDWIAFNRGATEHDLIEMQSLEARGTQRLGARE